MSTSFVENEEESPNEKRKKKKKRTLIYRNLERVVKLTDLSTPPMNP